MFLFTTTASPPEIPTPPALVRPAPAPVVQAIRDGASATGVGFDYLLATARRESALDPSAKAPTSSATGLFQFIEQTWLGTMKNAGPQLGLQAEADAIVRQTDGTYAVPDPGQKQAILDLRRDPKVAAVLAGALTQKNAQALQAATGQEPTPGDLYAAHVLGAKGAASLIATAKTFPERSAALDLPEAAAANRALFYDRTGRPRTAAELYASLAAAAHAAPAGVTQAVRLDGPAQATGEPPQAASSAMTATAFGGGSDLRSLFQTDRRATVSDAAAKLWQGRTSGTATARPAPSYFPRSDEAETERAAPVAVASADPDALPLTTGSLAPPPARPGSPLVNAPLPPRRPAEFGAGPSPNSLFAQRRGP
ncbi:lytic transglycosylase domain-containing protein [Methylobacterium sp. J-076]|uniref:lytic transglycosylase domain-containing protein n=1 Tax=Methylobacterium sp. J-076 TaxID=2836655 RepID=UPI001FB87F35|nr:lytic transglycosylase domain-containing protein [Methylobacterium sp. J-076]MCJ2012544.1 lytic transglycosylase domain-containing protein [Methylobacterium sp. J-076]